MERHEHEERGEAWPRPPTREARRYERMVPRQGRYTSEVLGLELEVVERKLRLWAGNALLLESEELLARMNEKRAAPGRVGATARARPPLVKARSAQGNVTPMDMETRNDH